MKRFEFFLDLDETGDQPKKRATVYAEVIKDQIWFHHEGRVVTVPIVESKRSKGKQGKALEKSDGKILSPMPGKILKVHVKPGAHVKEHQVLVIMEAMKMEYSLVSPGAGVVEKVNCAEGDQVALSSCLVEVKVSNGG